MTHDAQKILADFRDHLARHDKPLALLFGAGRSCAVRVGSGDKTEALIPAVAGITPLAKIWRPLSGATTYCGKNAFGCAVKEWVMAKADLDEILLQVIEHSKD